MINAEVRAFTHHVPMIVDPAPDFGVEFTDQIGGRHAERGVDYLPDATQKGFNILLGRLNEQFPVGILAHPLGSQPTSRHRPSLAMTFMCVLVAEAGEAALRELGTVRAALQLFLPRCGALLEDAVGGDADGIRDVEELTELVEKWQSEAGVAMQLDPHAGEGSLQTWHQGQQHGDDAGMTGGVSRPQPRRQQTSGVALEDQHGMIHVRAVGPVEEAELLLAVGEVVGGVEIEQDLAPLADLLAAEADERLAQPVVAAHQIASRGSVYQRRSVGWEPSATPGF